MLADHVVVSRELIRNSDVYAIIESNISVINYLLEGGAEPGELSPDALDSYYAGYYLAKVMNGGISQFMFNCSGGHQVLNHIIYVLPLPGATGHAGLLSEVRVGWDATDAEKKRVFFNGRLFNPLDPFEGIFDRVYEPNGSEDLIRLNSASVRNHPSLEVIWLKRLEAHLVGVIRTIPDLVARLVERERLVEENRPRYARIIDTIYGGYRMELVRITAGGPGFVHEGEEWIAWHFLIGHGHYSMVDMGERAVVFGDDGDEIAVIDVI